ncbi:MULTISPECIES: membrane protein insertase YidC [unclassified Sphingopyxis]|uniref:membrane protein insertase YidC n=1 Tax=unclassified Sphingopyxis TaxID=2614943 RepID=UPI0007306E15|nr:MULTISPECIES: membrane protein insertase YidC [unclassified Sphingopyxis]KTE21602.1 preprotein translocase YidC [Sphingopyxis sp. H057]KTE49599.1 preprotein translocase YidC [Sphingopyxis sp. H073]KTE49742.1 preprotein translocase YidC [Sphingopyxis sp. H071]KTE58226.1 preprotein translocase YidC [Sphingopyxis sp. H107]KTE62626.1 preprotein translocase YidC [Sphingopyxis sp. H100]
MDDKRNWITAILLSAAILLGWNFVAQKFFPTPTKPDVTKTVAGSPTAATATPGTPATPPATGATPAAPAVQAIVPVEAAVASANRVPIETPALAGSINLAGARIDDVTLTKYRQTIKKNAPPVRLFAPGNTKAAYFASVGWAAQGIEVPGPATVWSASGAKLTPTTPVTLSWSNTTGQTFRIEYSIDANYLITAKQTIANSGAAPVSASSFALIDRLGKPTDPHEQDSWTIHVGPTGYLDGKSVFDVNYKDLDEGTAAKYDSAGWLGFTDKYWLAAVVPAKGERVSASITSPAANNYQTLFARNFAEVAPGKQITTTTRIFAGAKEVYTLQRYEKDQGITRLSNAIDWGWFEFFAVPIFKLLDWLFRMVGNFGVAIMLLTLIIRGLMFPIAQRQFHSMAQMRLVQPKMKALQERYKDDKPRQQQELMKLYKDEKINPLAGCLPIVIQIPIFYALYKVLMLTIEMRHQPFALWIKDLSAPDPAHFLNLFGLLDFTPPSLLALGPLALILGITMFLQFRLNPQATDPVQQQVFKIMPWMFMFIMAPFAAGLLLYWITNNCLSIAQQQFMYRKFPALKAAPAK